MENIKLSVLIFLVLIPILAFGQIPKGHFIDADDSVKKGYKLKPFKQKKKGIYHYAILSELPFENDCGSDLSEKEQIDCSEKKLNKLISAKLNSKIEFKGDVYIYLTVTENAKIVDIKVKSYPQTEEIDKLFTRAIEQIEVKAGKFKNKIVKSRLWTSFKYE
ncbi:hypothetical protein [Tenacibaculum sp. M341]|uniref:hypothetical protein n=1 Tax=Tenacibaculum sp. M341 TaxID=2530339 RepID=UPI00104CBB2C|nr:hypothetical protein [Tenacibaculum sp. M341]